MPQRVGHRLDDHEVIFDQQNCKRCPKASLVQLHLFPPDSSITRDAGRDQADDSLVLAVGLSFIQKGGAGIAPNDPLLFIHARAPADLAAALALLEGAVTIA